jgi:hypothetical protein
MANEVQIIIKAIDKASAELKKVSGGLGALREVGKTVTMAMGGVAAAAGAVAVAYKSVVAPIVDYNKAILDAGRSTRMGVEDLSRFVQVGDDMGVSIDSITRALQMATKNGFAPSITAIADLADKANAMNTPTERAATLAKMFGRNWAELDPILQLGGQRIRELAASQAAGLVVTEEEIKRTEELRLRVDALTDTWIAYRNEIGLGIVEVVDLNVRATELTNTWAAQRLEMDGQKPTLIEYIRNWHLAEEALRATNGVTESGIVQAGLMAGQLRGVGEEIKALPTVWSLTLLMNRQGLLGGGIGGTEGPGIGGADQRAAEEYARFRENIRLQAESQRRIADEGAGTQGRFASDTSKPSGEFTGGNTPNDNAWRAYWDMMAEGSTDAAGVAKDLKASLDGIPPVVTSDVFITTYEIAGGGSGGTCFLAGTLVTMADGTERGIETVRVGDEVQSYDEASGMPIPSVVLSELPAIDNHINALQFSDGSTIHVTDHHHFLTQRGWIPAGALDEGDAMVGLRGAMSFVGRTRAERRVRVFNLSIATTHIYIAGGLVVHNAHGKALGADFVVPPGYPNDSYRMGVQSGEHVQVTPAGETAKSGANVNITVNSTPMDVQWITKQLKQAVGM